MKVWVIAVTAVLLLCATHARASTIPYPNVGTPNSVDQAVYAASTGTITAWFYGFDANDTDKVRIYDVTTGQYSDWFFENSTTPVGTVITLTMGGITNPMIFNGGDRLGIEVWNTKTGEVLAANPADSEYCDTASEIAGNCLGYSDPLADPYSHDYKVQWPSGGCIPGTTVCTPTTNSQDFLFTGLEDLSVLDPGADWDYNDDEFVFNNVTETPEPSSLLLLGSGLLGLAGLVRRKLHV